VKRRCTLNFFFFWFSCHIKQHFLYIYFILDLLLIIIFVLVAFGRKEKCLNKIHRELYSCFQNNKIKVHRILVFVYFLSFMTVLILKEQIYYCLSDLKWNCRNRTKQTFFAQIFYGYATFIFIRLAAIFTADLFWFSQISKQLSQSFFLFFCVLLISIFCTRIPLKTFHEDSIFRFTTLFKQTDGFNYVWRRKHFQLGTPISRIKQFYCLSDLIVRQFKLGHNHLLKIRLLETSFLILFQPNP
jgi:hypothetical protein